MKVKKKNKTEYVHDKVINMKIYLKDVKTPIADIDFESEEIIDLFVEQLNSSDRFIHFSQIVINKTEFKYAEINYLTVKRKAVTIK